MEFKLLRPFDKERPEIDQEPVDRLKERYDFNSDTDWAIYQAKVFYEVFGDVSKAKGILEEQLKCDSEDARLHFCLAECYSRNPASAEKCLEHCDAGLKIDPSSDYGHTIKARVELALQRPLDAYRSAMAALMINSLNFEAGVYLGIVGFALAASESDIEEMERSIENLRTTLSLNPKSKYLQNVIEEDERILASMR